MSRLNVTDRSIALIQLAQSWIFPPSCVLCGDRGQAPTLDICAACAADLPANSYPCLVCAQPLPAGAEGRWPCGECLKHRPVFDRALAPYLYGYPLTHLIHAFKYAGALDYGRVLGSLLALHIRAQLQALPEALIPVPLHPARHRERGFNQAFELARPLSELLGIPIAANLCRRRRATADQTELSAIERRKNVRNAFNLTAQPRFKHIAVIDDVLTTGSTTGELARVLRREGVERVEVWTVARADYAAKR